MKTKAIPMIRCGQEVPKQYRQFDKKGTRVEWIGAGKVSRLEGRAGQPCSGSTMHLSYDPMFGWSCVVRPDHRGQPGTFQMNAEVPCDKLRLSPFTKAGAWRKGSVFVASKTMATWKCRKGERYTVVRIANNPYGGQEQTLHCVDSKGKAVSFPDGIVADWKCVA